MKILVISQFASTPKYSTGSGERFFYLSQEFAKNQFETCVISAAFNHLFLHFPASPHMYNEERTEGAKYIWITIKKYSPKSSVGRIRSYLEFLLKVLFLSSKKSLKPDLVLVSSMSVFSVFNGLYLKWKYKIPFILEIRDIWPLTPIQLGGYSPNHPFIKLLRWTANLGYKHADHIVSVLPGFGRFLEENGFDQSKFTWIPNGIHEPIQKSPQIQKKVKQDHFTIAYTGAIGTSNAMEFLIAAAKLLKEEDGIAILIVGHGPEKAALEEASSDIPFITFKDKVSKNEVSAILAGVDCCYIGWRDKSLYNYGVGANKYNDYMKSQKPILSSSNIPDDPVRIANCGIQVAAEKPELIAKALREMRDTPIEQRNTWGTNGFNYLSKHFTYAKLAKKYMSVFDSTGDV